MFNIFDALFILPFILKFVLPVAVGVSVRSWVGIKHSHFQIGALEAATTIPVARDVYSGTILDV